MAGAWLRGAQAVLDAILAPTVRTHTHTGDGQTFQHVCPNCRNPLAAVSNRPACGIEGVKKLGTHARKVRPAGNFACTDAVHRLGLGLDALGGEDEFVKLDVPSGRFGKGAQLNGTVACSTEARRLKVKGNNEKVGQTRIGHVGTPQSFCPRPVREKGAKRETSGHTARGKNTTAGDRRVLQDRSD